MSEQVYQLIDEIRSKAAHLREQLKSECSTNAKLTTEIEALKDQLEIKANENGALQGKITELNERIEAISEQGVDQSTEKGISNEEIDTLVKEIEYCIGQLKR